MKLQEIEHEALALSEAERAALVLSLMDTLAAPGADIGDDEVLRRDAELESGKVAPMTHEEFVQSVQKSRRR
jgi:putative addiction module component (TIGR02574 family)